MKIIIKEISEIIFVILSTTNNNNFKPNFLNDVDSKLQFVLDDEDTNFLQCKKETFVSFIKYYIPTIGH